jgi:hypothetical protein
MLTAVVLMLSVALILVVGESVRGQVRRMLSKPVLSSVPVVADEPEAAPANAAA